MLSNLKKNGKDLKTASVACDFGSRYSAQTYVRQLPDYQHYLEFDNLMEAVPFVDIDRN